MGVALLQEMGPLLFCSCYNAIMSSSDFYEKLMILTDFTAVTDPTHYQPIPDDWSIVVADVSGSTQAIEQGLYKAVNFLGEWVIIGVLNLTKPTAVPFVFGGDGAAVCIPPHLATAVPDTLRAIRSLAYGLHVAGAALMICGIVERTNEHFHLIDGANGGYAKAAQQLKQQLVGTGE